MEELRADATRLARNTQRAVGKMFGHHSAARMVWNGPCKMRADDVFGRAAESDGKSAVAVVGKSPIFSRGQGECDHSSDHLVAGDREVKRSPFILAHLLEHFVIQAAGQI